MTTNRPTGQENEMSDNLLTRARKALKHHRISPYEYGVVSAAQSGYEAIRAYDAMGGITAMTPWREAGDHCQRLYIDRVMDMMRDGFVADFEKLQKSDVVFHMAVIQYFSNFGGVGA